MNTLKLSAQKILYKENVTYIILKIKLWNTLLNVIYIDKTKLIKINNTIKWHNWIHWIHYEI